MNGRKRPEGNLIKKWKKNRSGDKMNLQQTDKAAQRRKGGGSQTGASPSCVRLSVRPSVHPPVRLLSLEEGLDVGVLGALQQTPPIRHFDVFVGSLRRRAQVSRSASGPGGTTLWIRPPSEGGIKAGEGSSSSGGVISNRLHKVPAGTHLGGPEPQSNQQLHPIISRPLHSILA